VHGKPEISNNIEDHCSDVDSDTGHRSPLAVGPDVVRGTIDFSAYKEFKLHPLKDIEMPEPDDRSYSIVAFCLFPTTVSHDWRMRAGGVLFALGEYGDFFNSMVAYHGRGKSTSIAEWDTLFEKLKNSEYRKNLIPCMVSYCGPVSGS
jgi:hypothetical protein